VIATTVAIIGGKPLIAILFLVALAAILMDLRRTRT
jgi:hypothetical protein